MTNKKTTVKAGDALLCLNGHRLATVARDIEGRTPLVEDFRSWHCNKPAKGTVFRCHHCWSTVKLMVPATYKMHAMPRTVMGRAAVPVPQIFDPKQPVYIVGGGESLDDFDWELLVGKQVIATNKAMFTCKDATVGFFGFAEFYNWHKDAGGNDFWRFKGDHIFTTADIPLHEDSRIQRLALKDETFSKDPEYLAAPDGVGLNTGWQAINLAYLAGARTVYLLGYDCAPGQFHRNKSYAHKNEPAAAVYDRYAIEFSNLAKAIKSRRLKFDIINANMGSRLDCWPKCPRDEAFN